MIRVNIMHILKNLKKAAFWIDYGLQDYWIRHKLKKLNQEDADLTKEEHVAVPYAALLSEGLP